MYCIFDQDGDLEEMPITQLLKYIVDKGGKRPQKRPNASFSSQNDPKKKRLDLTKTLIDLSSSARTTPPSGIGVVDAQPLLRTPDTEIVTQSPLPSAQSMIKQENTEDFKNAAEDAEYQLW